MRILLLCFLLTPFAPTAPSFGQSPSDRTPADCHVYVEFRDAADLVKRIESTSLTQAIIDHPAYLELLNDPNLVLVRNIWGILAPHLKGQTSIGLRLAATGPSVFLCAKHEGQIDLHSLARSLTSLSKDFDIENEGKTRGIKWVTLGKAGILGLDDNFLYWGERPSSLREVGRLKKEDCMTQSRRFQLMKKSSKSADFMILVNTSELLDGKPFGGGELKEALEILLFQGILEDVDASVFAFGYGSWTNRLQLHVRLMNREKRLTTWSTPSRTRPQEKTIPGEMARVYFDRDLSQFWRQRMDLIPESGKAALAQFSQTINIFLAGFPFDQLMAKTKGGLELVSAKRENLKESPETILPSFAMVVDTTFSVSEQQRFQVAFQTAIGVINADAEQNRRQPMLQGSQTVQGVNILTARFLDDPKTQRKTTEYNFTPSLAFANNTLILSSDLSLAGELVKRSLSRVRPNNVKKVRGDSVELSGKIASEMLRLNRTYFIDQRFLDAGEDEVEATRYVEGFFRIFETVDRVVIKHIVLERSTVWDLDVRLVEAGK